MKVVTKGHTTVLIATQGDCGLFLENIIINQHESYKNQNLILDLTHNKSTTIQSIKAFSELSILHCKIKTFVIVAENIDFNALPKSLVVVPSVLEAHDIIDMDEIERDLGF